jgi:heat-inducible transcriptional repressor
MAEPLSDRARDVLHAIIREYISMGGPVGSQQLARTSGFEVSSATLRNVMADLEDLGYLEKPHTSAGRVPTDRAYRFYVDTLIRLREPNPRDRELIQRGIHTSGTPLEDSLQEAGRILHFLTRHAGVVLTPRPTSGTFHRIEFVRLREGRVLAILIDQDGQVHNRPVALDFGSPPRSWSGRPTTSASCWESSLWSRYEGASSRSWPRTRPPTISWCPRP